MLSSLLAGPAVPAKERSVLPALKGLPWWGAVLVAVGATAIGAMIDTDSGSTLGRSFKLFYLFGCVLAALAVRQRALFTAAAQPPLVAFIVGVTALYTINSGTGDQGMKQIILKVVLPIATSFPWILLTFLLTLAIVVARWFLARPKGKALFGKAVERRPAAKPGARKPGAQKPAARKSAGQQAGAKKTGTGRPGEKKATTAKTGAPAKSANGERARTTSRPARPRPEDPRPAAPRSGKPAPTKRRPSEGPTQTAATAVNPGADRPRRKPAPEAGPTTRVATRPVAQSAAPSEPRPTPVPQRPAPTPESRRRAAPQTIPARDPKTPRRTAGQLRDTGAIEDLTAGADER